MKKYTESVQLPAFDNPAEVTIVIAGDDVYIRALREAMVKAIQEIAIPAINNYQAERTIAKAVNSGCHKC